MASIMKNWPRIVVWALVLGVLTSLLADWGEWDRILVNLLWRVLIIAIGGLLGLVLNFFASGYVSMGTNVIESMGMTRFSEDRDQKIANAFVFVGAFLGAIVALIFIK
jgi:hypothetical protein